jgi:hypothetical protein
MIASGSMAPNATCHFIRLENRFSTIREMLDKPASEVVVKKQSASSPFSDLVEFKTPLCFYTENPHWVQLHVYSSVEDGKNYGREQLTVVMVVQNDLASTCQMLDEYFFGEAYKQLRAQNPPALPEKFTGVFARSPKYGPTLRFKLEPAPFSHHFLEMETLDADHVYSMSSAITLDRLRYWIHRRMRNVEFCFRISAMYILKCTPQDPLPRMGVVARLTHIRLMDGQGYAESMGFPFTQLLGIPPPPLPPVTFNEYPNTPKPDGHGHGQKRKRKSED